MRRVTVGLLLCLVVVLCLMCGAPYSAALDDPPATHTPTPDWTQPLTLSSGQPARVSYEISAGDFVVGFLEFAQLVILLLILYQLTRNRLQTG